MKKRGTARTARPSAAARPRRSHRLSRAVDRGALAREWSWPAGHIIDRTAERGGPDKAAAREGDGFSPPSRCESTEAFSRSAGPRDGRGFSCARSGRAWRQRLLARVGILNVELAQRFGRGPQRRARGRQRPRDSEGPGLDGSDEPPHPRTLESRRWRSPMQAGPKTVSPWSFVGLGMTLGPPESGPSAARAPAVGLWHNRPYGSPSPRWIRLIRLALALGCAGGDAGKRSGSRAQLFATTARQLHPPWRRLREGGWAPLRRFVGAMKPTSLQGDKTGAVHTALLIPAPVSARSRGSAARGSSAAPHYRSTDAARNIPSDRAASALRVSLHSSFRGVETRARHEGGGSAAAIARAFTIRAWWGRGSCPSAHDRLSGRRSGFRRPYCREIRRRWPRRELPQTPLSTSEGRFHGPTPKFFGLASSVMLDFLLGNVHSRRFQPVVPRCPRGAREAQVVGVKTWLTGSRKSYCGTHFPGGREDWSAAAHRGRATGSAACAGRQSSYARMRQALPPQTPRRSRAIRVFAPVRWPVAQGGEGGDCDPGWPGGGRGTPEEE